MKEYYAKQAPMNKKAAAKYAKIVEVEKNSEMKTSAPVGDNVNSGKRKTSIKPVPARKVTSQSGFVE